MKRVLSVILCLAVMMGMCVFGASAATSGNFTYTTSGNSATITGFNKSVTGAVSIPSTLGGKAVTKIGRSAFAECEEITAVTIPSSVTEIDENAFIFCSKLAEINVTDNIQCIGVGAFFDTAYYLNDKNWKNGVLYVGNHLVDSQNGDTPKPISGVCIIRNGTLTIGDSAFVRCTKLDGVVIPKSVRRICCDAFYYCTSMKTVYYCGTPSQWKKITIEEYNDEIKTFKIIYAGDLDFDGKTNSSDALLVLKASTGVTKLTDTQKAMGDLNLDSVVNAGDALKILQLTTGLATVV